jgi:methionine-rich copper-binding protein CopC
MTMINRRILTTLVLALALSFGALGTALAHAKLVSSDPAAGAKLTAAPAKITLVFSEEISEKESESNFTVADESGAAVGTGKLDTTDLDHKTLSGALKAGLGDGVYTVTWAAVTPYDDGHSEGSFTFGVNKDPGAQPTAVPEHDEETPTSTPGSAAQPTARPAATPTPAATPAGGAAPSTLPKTAGETTSASGYLLLGAIVVLIGGVALRIGKRGTR